MGRAIALELARAGADLALGRADRTSLDAVAAEVEALGRRAVCVPPTSPTPRRAAALPTTAARELGRDRRAREQRLHRGGLARPVRRLRPRALARPVRRQRLRLAHADAGVRAAPRRRRAAGSIVMITTLVGPQPDPAARRLRGVEAGADDRGAGARPGARARRDPGQLRRAGPHPGRLARRVLRVDRRAAGITPGRRRRDRRASTRCTTSPPRGDRTRGPLLRVRPVAGHHRPDARRELRPDHRLVRTTRQKGRREMLLKDKVASCRVSDRASARRSRSRSRARAPTSRSARAPSRTSRRSHGRDRGARPAGRARADRHHRSGAVRRVSSHGRRRLRAGRRARAQRRSRPTSFQLFEDVDLAGVAPHHGREPLRQPPAHQGGDPPR